MSTDAQSVRLELTPDECAEVMNALILTAFHAMEDDNDGAWRSVEVSIAVADKLEAAYPDIVEHDEVCCVKELLIVKRRLARRAKTQTG